MFDELWLQQTLTKPGYRVIGQVRHTTLPDDTPEAILLARIRQLAKVNGFALYHTHNSQKSDPGFPDLVLTDGTSLLMYELKTNTGKLTHEQNMWLSLLAHTEKTECGIWRPKDWASIQARLVRAKH